jgi:hypothetical protein
MTASETGEPGDCRQQKQKRTARWRTAPFQEDRGTHKNACGFWNSPCTGIYGLIFSFNKGIVFYASLLVLTPGGLWIMRR